MIRTRDEKFDSKRLFKDNEIGTLGVSKRVSDYIKVITPLPRLTTTDLDIEELSSPLLTEKDSSISGSTDTVLEKNFLT